MIMRPEFKLIGRGVYSVAEASRLTGVRVDRINRWARGYTYRYRGQERFSPPIIGLGAGEGESPILQFQDIIEIRFLNAFRRHGVSWRTIRLAAGRAMEIIGTRNPFATKVFRTDGRRILLEMVEDGSIPEDRCLLELVGDQLEWESFIRPFLREEEIDFNAEDEPERWWPLGKGRQVVLDPGRSFGAPIVNHGGVQTYILAQAVAVEGDAELVADWYEVPLRAVQDAVEFEKRLRSAA